MASEEEQLSRSQDHEPTTDAIKSEQSPVADQNPKTGIEQ